MDLRIGQMVVVKSKSCGGKKSKALDKGLGYVADIRGKGEGKNMYNCIMISPEINLKGAKAFAPQDLKNPYEEFGQEQLCFELKARKKIKRKKK